MVTDEQLVDRLRRGLAPLRPHDDLIDRLRAQAGDDERAGRGGLRQLRGGRGRPRQSLGALALVAAVVVSIGIAAGALVLLHHRGAGATTPETHGPTLNRPGPVTAGQVAAPLTLRVVGERRRLVQLSFTARRATGLHSWYAWNLAAPPRCGSSTGGPTRKPVRVGARLVFDGRFAADCHGTITAAVSYFTQAPNADSERGVLVGRGTLRLP